MKKSKILISVVATAALVTPMLVHAATVQPGGTFTATANCGIYEGAVTVSASNATVTGADNFCDRGKTLRATATAGGAGTASVSFTVIDATDTNAMALVGNVNIGGTTVTVASPQTNNGGGQKPQTPQTPQTPQKPVEDNRSKNNNLASLAVSEGKLSPAFNAGTTEYRVDLAASVTSINITASAADAKAKVSGTGTKEVEPGENKLAVTVTAENGSTKTYTIVAVVDEKPLVYTKYNGKSLGVVRNLRDIKAPKDFVETTVKIEGKEVKAWKNDAMKVTLVYLVDEKTSEKNFYIYDTKEQKVTNIFKPTALLGNNVYLVDIPKELQEMTGFKYGKVKVDTTELMGWTFEDKAFNNYAVIYVMDEAGKMQYYMYEKTQNTLQLYSKAAPITQETYEKLVKDLDKTNMMQIIFLGIAAVMSVVAIVAVVFAIKLKKLVK